MILDDMMKAMEELRKATDALELSRMRHREAEARAEDCAGKVRRGLNALNLAQKNVDELAIVLRGDAPFNSDWWKISQRSGERSENIFHGDPQ